MRKFDGLLCGSNNAIIYRGLLGTDATVVAMREGALLLRLRSNSITRQMGARQIRLRRLRDAV
jgi:hypothetical protein